MLELTGYGLNVRNSFLNNQVAAVPRSQVIAHAKEAGFKWIRADLSPQFNYFFPDIFIPEIIAAGLGFVAVCAYNKSDWVGGADSHTGVTNQTNRDLWTAWFAQTISRYGSDNVVYEVWNEPDDTSSQFWLPNTTDVTNYKALFEAAVTAGHFANRDARILGPATANYNQSWHRSIAIGPGFESNVVDTVHFYQDLSAANLPAAINAMLANMNVDLALYGKAPQIAVTETGLLPSWIDSEADQKEKYQAIHETLAAQSIFHVLYEYQDRVTPGNGLRREDNSAKPVWDYLVAAQAVAPPTVTTTTTTTNRPTKRIPRVKRII